MLLFCFIEMYLKNLPLFGVEHPVYLNNKKSPLRSFNFFFVIMSDFEQLLTLDDALINWKIGFRCKVH